jgi:hypothetical protein
LPYGQIAWCGKFRPLKSQAGRPILKVAGASIRKRPPINTRSRV